MRNFKKYDIWQLSNQFSLLIYKLSQHFPKDEQYGLTSQLRRAALSIPTNISEGCGREGEKEFAAYVNIALGSANETENLIIIAYELDYLKPQIFENLSTQINLLKRKIYTLRQKLINKQA